jgi:hypothetical protein
VALNGNGAPHSSLLYPVTMRSPANVSQQIRRFEANLENQSDPRIHQLDYSVKICGSSLFRVGAQKDAKMF